MATSFPFNQKENALDKAVREAQNKKKAQEMGGGFSYVDKKTGKSYEVDPSGKTKEINRSGGGGSSSRKKTTFVPPTPIFDFNKIAEQQKATQQAQQEKNLRDFARKQELQRDLLNKINIRSTKITFEPPMSVSKNAEREQQFRNANVFVSSNTGFARSGGVTIYTDKRGNTTGKTSNPRVVVPKGINTRATYELEDGTKISGYGYVSNVVKESGGDNTWHIRDASKLMSVPGGVAYEKDVIKQAEIDKAWVLEEKVLDTRGGIPTIEYKWKNKITGETQKLTKDELKEITRGTVEKIITPKWNKAPFERLTKELNDINNKYGTYGSAGYGNRIAISFSVGAAKATKDMLYGVLRPDKAIAGLYDLAKQLKNNPKEVYSNLEYAARENPYQTLGYISAMLAAYKVSPILKKKSVSTLQKLRSKISSKYIKQVNGKFIVRGRAKETFKVKGKTKYLAERVQKPSIKRPFTSVVDFLKGRKPGQFKKFTKDPGLILKAQTVKSGAKSLSEQVKLAGREVTAVNAAADQLTSWIRRKIILRKPIPGEANFPLKIKQILKRFDSGIKLNNKEFAYVNKWLTKNVAPNITLLERSLYLDPSAGLRISRLGIQTPRTATLRDILRGNFKLWDRSKPQVLIFENAKIAKFPKSLTTIKNKLLSGKKLTIAETNKLIRWQVKTGSGKFKPIGSTIYQGGRELEITLAPGEMIKRIKNVGFTYINGKKVTFVTAEVLKPSKVLIKKIKLAQSGNIVGKNLDKLNNQLSKLLGRKVKIETPSIIKNIAKEARRLDPNVPVLRIRLGGIFVAGTIGRLGNIARGKVTRRTPVITRKRTPKRITTPRIKTARRTPVITRKRTPKRITTPRKPTSRIPSPRKPTGGRRTNIPVKKTKPLAIARFPSKDIKKTKLKQFGYIVYAKPVKGKKLVKVNNIPLTENRALDLRNYIADTSLSRTAMIKQVKQPPKETRMKVPVGYSSRTSYKFRDYRIKNKRKLFFKNRRVIEKNKHILDTVGEKKRISLARRIKQLGLKQQPKRKITSSQRKILLERLKKARAVRMRNLKRK